MNLNILTIKPGPIMLHLPQIIPKTDEAWKNMVKRLTFKHRVEVEERSGRAEVYRIAETPEEAPEPRVRVAQRELAQGRRNAVLGDITDHDPEFTRRTVARRQIIIVVAAGFIAIDTGARNIQTRDARRVPGQQVLLNFHGQGQ